MQVIPVMDLMGGQVVRAVRGDRARYQPVRSRLCQGADPLRLARRLCEHCATDTLYVADLDALQGGSAQVDLLARLLAAQPGLRLWLDAGFTDAAAAERLMDELGGRVTPVYGSESLRTGGLPPPSQAILSLDSRGGARLGEPGIWQAAQGWTGRLIVMTLDRVGSAEGPDLEALAAIGRLAPLAMRVGAGGIRGLADLQTAAAAGANAWLVASALHDGLIPGSGCATDCDGAGQGDDTLSQARERAGPPTGSRTRPAGAAPASPPMLANALTSATAPAAATSPQERPTMAHALR